MSSEAKTMSVKVCYRNMIKFAIWIWKHMYVQFSNKMTTGSTNSELFHYTTSFYRGSCWTSQGFWSLGILTAKFLLILDIRMICKKSLNKIKHGHLGKLKLFIVTLAVHRAFLGKFWTLRAFWCWGFWMLEVLDVGKFWTLASFGRWKVLDVEGFLRCFFFDVGDFGRWMF